MKTKQEPFFAFYRYLSVPLRPAFSGFKSKKIEPLQSAVKLEELMFSEVI